MTVPVLGLSTGGSEVEIEPQPFAFTGTGGEYFRIWIVNVLLSVVTLGIYSAWAKVRRLRYFHQNTRVAGFAFDYLASPMGILRGRLIAAAGLAVYVMAGMFGPLLALAAAVLLACVAPWLIARSLKFRLHNTSYRGLRFRFTGSTRSAYWVFLALPVLSVFTLFLLMPFTQHRVKRYQYGNAYFGRTAFSFAAPVGEFYVALVAAGFISGLIVFVGVIAIAIGSVMAGVPAPDGPTREFDTIPVAMMVGFFAVYATGIVAGQAFATARIQNAVWDHTRLGRHRFVCSLGAAPLFGILFTNLLLTVVTVGLYRPFAQVRLASYMAGALTAVPGGPLDELAATEEGDVSAVGSEAADLFDFDIGL